MIIEYLLLAFLACYLVQIAVVTVAILRLHDRADASATPSVSVVIAARDEEQNIAACLESVLNQTYPSNLYEVVVVNDHSTDRTEFICQQFVTLHKNFRHVNAEESAILRGKTNALDQGIAAARNEVILITDADCTVPPSWIENTAKRYSPSVGLVGGLTIQKAANWFEGMQSLDWVYLLGLAAATIVLRIPLSTIGNNLSFRKSAYHEVGGYQKIPFSVTEDFVLFQAIVRLRKWVYLCPVDPEVLVTSQPCSTWIELIRQKHRWGTGGLDMNMQGMLVMVVGFGLHTTLLMGVFLLDPLFLGLVLSLKLLGDVLFLGTILKRLQKIELFRFFLPFACYFFFYVLFLPFIVLLGGRVRWKGRSY